MVKGVDHKHGDSGEKPDDGRDFQDGAYPDPEEFDWFWTEVPEAINDHKDLLEAIDPEEIVLDEYSNMSASKADRVLITTDENGIHYDDGSSLHLIADHPSNIDTDDLGFDPATQSELEDYAVAESGDTMTGELDMEDTVDANNSGGRIVLPVGEDKYAE